MRRFSKLTIFLLAFVFILNLCGCEKMDADYGKSMPVESSEISTTDELIYPEIKSSDEIMPKYFDISQFDEENYSTSYLGKKFDLKTIYAGTTISLPISYSKIEKLGWNFTEDSQYDVDSVITAGKSIEVTLCNEYDKLMNVVFFNSAKSSKKLSKCNIVKLIIPENCLNTTESNYGLFWVNGVTNQSAINNIVEYWGIPSHFYKVDCEHYYFDYFFTRDSKRSGITVHVDPENDILLSIEIAVYD